MNFFVTESVFFTAFTKKFIEPIIVRLRFTNPNTSWMVDVSLFIKNIIGCTIVTVCSTEYLSILQYHFDNMLITMIESCYLRQPMQYEDIHNYLFLKIILVFYYLHLPLSEPAKVFICRRSGPTSSSQCKVLTCPWNRRRRTVVYLGDRGMYRRLVRCDTPLQVADTRPQKRHLCSTSYRPRLSPTHRLSSQNFICDMGGRYRSLQDK